jgi:hypothetical protein
MIFHILLFSQSGFQTIRAEEARVAFILINSFSIMILFNSNFSSLIIRYLHKY